MRAKRRLIGLAVSVVLLLEGSVPVAAAPTDAELRGLQGGWVVVTMKSKAEVSGWLVRVGPKALLIGRGNNTFVKAERTKVADVRNARRLTGERPRSQAPRARATRPPSTRLEAPNMRLSGNHLWFWGMGLTLGGLTVGAVGQGLLWKGTISIWNDDPHPLDTPAAFISTAVLSAVGIGALLTGIPMWVTGAVRRNLTNAGPLFEARKKRWLLAGKMTLVGSLLGMAVGGTMLAIALGSRYGGEALLWSGTAVATVGLFSALLVAVPMLVEACRHRPHKPSGRPGRTIALGPNPQPPQMYDQNHEQSVRSRLQMGQPRATLFSTQFAF